MLMVRHLCFLACVVPAISLSHGDSAAAARIGRDAAVPARPFAGRPFVPRGRSAPHHFRRAAQSRIQPSAGGDARPAAPAWCRSWPGRLRAGPRTPAWFGAWSGRPGRLKTGPHTPAWCRARSDRPRTCTAARSISVRAPGHQCNRPQRFAAPAISRRSRFHRRAAARRNPLRSQ